ncbi:homeobox protein BEL1 homolog [Phragmites australis]|uniref:homeobox protein BEL1 homolog n=1 Tax=Phragmites australis TaxID=29695 RepID=UPI002D79FD82|nr:homeobox protein BEL1 homolog [Phragmites australis]
MAVHHHHLLDFSPPPNAVPMEAPPPSFDHGQLVALHVDGTDMPAGGVLPHRVLADDSATWPQVVNLSLFNYNTGGGSLFSHQQPFAAPPAVAMAPNLPATTLHPFQLRSSKYLGPVKELLGEFCSLEGDLHAMNSARRAPKAGKWDDVEALSSSSSGGLWGNPSLSSMDLLDLERRKARLLSMVGEVDRRYRRYREQMRAVEVSLEAVAGVGAAQVYTRLALRAMSRHFRCLRDALVAQVRALRKAMGERDGGAAAAPTGATKGDTPRLKILDRSLRQQRAFQQPGAMENYPWRPQRGLPERAVAVLRAWLFEHFLHPYPNDVDKHILARQTGLSRSQVSNWFINARVRLWKPMIEDMYTEEVKQQPEANQNPSSTGVKPEKDTTASATAIGGETHHFRNPDSMISSSIVTDRDHLLFHGYPSMNGGGSTVSLTLGLQQQPFASSMMHQRSLMLQGQEEETTTVLPYRNLNLMGSQLLHDFAG